LSNLGFQTQGSMCQTSVLRHPPTLLGCGSIVEGNEMRMLVGFGLAALVCSLAHPAAAARPQGDRGRQLVIVSSSGDCHTPGALTGKPDETRFLGGSDVGFAIP